MNSSEKIKFVKEVYKGELVRLENLLDEKISEPRSLQAQEISYFFIWIVMLWRDSLAGILISILCA